jgi:hypothetical protein
MKKILLSCLILGFIFIGCSTTEQLAMSSLYSITDSSKEDIRGTINVSRLLISKGITMLSNEAVTIDRAVQENVNEVSITVQYLGPDWRYMTEIMLKIDNDLITLEDKSPIRTVNRTNNVVTVNEIVTCELNQDIIDKLKSCNSLTIQYFNKPISIPQDGIEEQFFIFHTSS